MRWLVLIFLAGCGESDPCAGKPGVCIAVHVSGSAPTLDALSVNVTKSDGNVLHGDSGLAMPKISLPVQFALRLPTGTTGKLEVAVLGVVAGNFVASGSGSVEVPAGGHGRVDVTLAPSTADLSSAPDDGSVADRDSGMDLGTLGGDGSMPGEDLATAPDLNGGVGFGPSPLDFGEVATNKTVSGTLTLSNGGPLITITAVNLTGDPSFTRTGGTCAAQMPVGTGQTCTVVISYTSGANPRAVSGHVDVLTATDSYGANLLAHTTGWVLETAPSVSPMPNFYSVSGTSPSDVWVGGSNGKIYHRGSNGKWTAPTGTLLWGSTAPVHVYTPAPGTIYASATGLFYSGDSGATWHQAADQFGSDHAEAVFGFDATDIFAGSDNGRIEFGSYVGGWTIEANTTQPIIGDIFGAGTQAYALAGNRVYQRNAGLGWVSMLDESTTAVLEGGAAVAAGDYYVSARLTSATCGSKCAAMFHVSSAGTSETDLIGTELDEVWVNGPNDIWAVGQGGTVYFSNGGNFWALVTVPTANNLNDVWGNAGELFVVGAAGTILHHY